MRFAQCCKKYFFYSCNDETSSGVQSISVNNDSRIIYVSLLKQDEITKISYPHIYRNTYNIGNGALGSCWSEITNNLPSKNLQILMSKGSSTSETLYGALRGMGEWKCDICMVISCSILKPTCNLNDGQALLLVLPEVLLHTYGAMGKQPLPLLGFHLERIQLPLQTIAVVAQLLRLLLRVLRFRQT